MEGNIIIRGARVNNLKNVSLEIPRGRLVVVTGISGSGKSSLAFDTLYAEGQRRFAESLSSYARQFLGRMSKPDVESIEGIPPAIAIEQKVSVKNPRSTVATTTEIYDYLKLVYARIGRIFSPVSGCEVRASTIKDVMDYIFGGAPEAVYILSPLGWDERDDRVELMLSLKEEGFSRLFNPGSGEIVPIDSLMPLAETGDFPAGLLLLIDRAKVYDDADLRQRISSSVDTAFSRGNGVMYVYTPSGNTLQRFSTRLEADGMTFRECDEYLFSFNSPLGACPVCGGLGKIIGVSEDLVVPDKTKSIYESAIACWRGEKMSWFKEQLIKNASRYGIPIFTPYCQLTDEQKKTIWETRSNIDDDTTFCGINEFFEWVEQNRYKIQYKYMLSRYSGRTTCSACGGSRLRKEALWVKVGGKNIHELMSMDVDRLIPFFENIDISEHERNIAGKAIDEIIYRLHCISDVGLGYLTLDRAMNTLSGGESQRVNLVTALGSSLVGSLYILDEPSIGLHSRDTERLIAVLRRLRDIGNTVVVVEHDASVIAAADYLIDMGPRAGINGGEVVFSAPSGASFTDDVVSASLTLQYLRGIRRTAKRAKRPWQYYISVEGAMQNNLKDITVKFPLGAFTVVSGVSGSGKSSLVGDILYPALNRRLNESGDLPGTFRGLGGNLDRITRVEFVDQNPIGKSSRSNAVTYLKVYDDIRKLLAAQQFAKINGFTPSFFSFNQDGGRCPECQGDGFVRIGMQFMADVTMVCSSCSGKRFKAEILEVRYRGKNVDDILSMSVEEAIDFFASSPDEEARRIAIRLQPLVDVGLGYIKLGQPSSTLSGGESQRIKLAYFLSLSLENDRPRKDRILFIFDEPTTGLHFYDVDKLLKAFDMLLSKGHTVVVVEHNLDVIRSADWVIDLGPDAGDRGGEIVFEGTPEELMEKGHTFTADFLRSAATNE
ncbi:MAG: excinuclease ABC subunit UvrA [Bacteroidales bacterium]|nr:excinuclease ABC subunit UvrA [Bacteroidales bacterium]